MPAPAAANPSVLAGQLARKVCAELHALTGNSGAWIMLDILERRVRAPWAQLLVAASLAELQGWVSRRGRHIGLTEKGRRMVRGEPMEEETLPAAA
jgi:hypothetical protein